MPTANRQSEPKGKRPPSAGVNLGSFNLSLSNTQSPHLTVVQGSKPGQMKVIIPQRHDCAALFDKLMDDEEGTSDLRKLCVTLFGVVEVLAMQRVAPDRIPLDLLRKAVVRHV